MRAISSLAASMIGRRAGKLARAYSVIGAATGVRAVGYRKAAGASGPSAFDSRLRERTLSQAVSKVKSIGGACTSTRDRASMTRRRCGWVTSTERTCSPNAPTPVVSRAGAGVTSTTFDIRLWSAEVRGVRRSTQRAKVTSDS